MENKDLTRFKHMLESAQAILSFARGRKRIDLDKDRQFLSAVVREFEIIGKAAGRISKKTQKQFPKIPWKNTIGMRNRLIHAYFHIDHDVVWRTIRDYLPSLCQQLEQIITTLEQEQKIIRRR